MRIRRYISKPKGVRKHACVMYIDEVFLFVQIFRSVYGLRLRGRRLYNLF